jgi:hypothetical protein
MANLAGYLRMRFPDGRPNGNEWNICCPSCGHPKERASVNMDTGKANCYHCPNFRARGWYELIQKLEGLARNQVGLWIEEHKEELGESPVSTTITRIPLSMHLPMECERIVRGDPYWGYLVNRSLVDHEFEAPVTWRKCETGKYAGRIIIPIYEEGSLVYFFDRSILPDTIKTIGIGGGKYYWPIHKSHVVYGLEKLARDILMAEPRKIQIAEGIFSAMSVSPWCLALLGKVCSDKQLGKILKLRPQHVELCLDPDAHAHAMHLAAKLHSFGVPASIRWFERGDPNDYRVKGWFWPTEHPYSLMLEARFAAGMLR